MCFFLKVEVEAGRLDSALAAPGSKEGGQPSVEARSGARSAPASGDAVEVTVEGFAEALGAFPLLCAALAANFHDSETGELRPRPNLQVGRSVGPTAPL